MHFCGFPTLLSEVVELGLGGSVLSLEMLWSIIGQACSASEL